MCENAVFTTSQETQIANHLISLSNIFYGSIRWQFLRLAFECAEKHNINQTFNKQQRLAERSQKFKQNIEVGINIF